MSPGEPELWPHQTAALQNALEALDRGGRTQLHMACGSGKTRIAVEIVRAMNPRTLLFLTPTIELAAQAADDFAAALPAPRQLLVCAPSEKRLRGRKTTTDSAVIAENLREEGPLHIFCTYASAKTAGRAFRELGRDACLAVADEAHRTTGLDGRLYTAWLDNRVLPTRKRLAMTATPRVMGGGIAGLKVWSMDNAAHFGSVAFRYPFLQAVSDGVACDFEVLAPLITIEGIDEEEAKAQGLLRAIKDYDLHKILSFHGTVAEAARLAARLRSHGVEAQAVHGRMRRDDITAARRRLEDGGQFVLCNARLFSEGINVPALDAVYFCSIKSSVVDITQQVGRAVRKSPGKKRGYVILPPATGDDLDRVLERRKFRPLWAILSSLYDIYQMPDNPWEYGPRIERPDGPESLSVRVRVLSDNPAVTEEAFNASLATFIAIREAGIAEHVWRRNAELFLGQIRRGKSVNSTDLQSWWRWTEQLHQEKRLPASRLDLFYRIKNLLNENIVREELARRAEIETMIDDLASGASTLDYQIVINKFKNHRYKPWYDRQWERYRRIMAGRSDDQRKRLEAYIERIENGEPIKCDKGAYSTLSRPGSPHKDLARRLRAEARRRKKDDFRPELELFVARIENGEKIAHDVELRRSADKLRKRKKKYKDLWDRYQQAMNTRAKASRPERRRESRAELESFVAFVEAGNPATQRITSRNRLLRHKERYPDLFSRYQKAVAAWTSKRAADLHIRRKLGQPSARRD